MEINGKDTLRILLRDGEYKMAFEYLFLMGKSMEMDTVVKLLDALRGYRLSFYHLDDHRIDTYVVSNRMRVPLSKLLLSLQGNFRALLGSFSEDEIRKVLAIRDTVIHQSRALDDKYAKLMERWDRFESTPFKDSINRSFNGFIRNPKTNRMLKVRSQRYKDQFPESKKKRGRPRKCIWGGYPLAYAGSMLKDSMEREFVDKYLDKVSLRCIMLIYDDVRTDELFVGTLRVFLKHVLTKGLSKYGIVDIFIGKDVKVSLPMSGLVMNPQTHRTNSMKT